MKEPTPRPVTYWDYIRVEELLALQGGVERDAQKLSNDEVMFITVHQVFELWFQLVLRELRSARDLFCAPRVEEQQLSGAVRSLKRVSAVLLVMTHQWPVMETMATREYLGFRDKLMGASGFQSAQLRQIEILMGLDDAERVPLGLEKSYKQALRAADGASSPALARVERALTDTPTLKDAIRAWLYRTPIDGVAHDDPQAEKRLAGFVERFLEAHAREADSALARADSLAVYHDDPAAERKRLAARFADEKKSVREFLQPTGADAGRLKRVRAAMIFIETYRELPLLAWPREVLDTLVEMEQLMVVFRQRHARMVERMIGRRTGTGGSAGVEYLDETARRYRVFRDLWAIRTLQIPRSAAPRLENPGFYGFKSGS